MSRATAGTPDVLALDTDIGTDVDDLLAVAMILGSPEITVPLITTVYGDVALRARIVAAAYSAAARPTPRVVAGCSETLSGREVWWPGHEGETIDDLASYPVGVDADAPAELAATGRILAIAPLTNVALAVGRSDTPVSEVIMMGGEFVRGITEHNIRCDITAAQRVFAANVPVTAVGLDQTERVRLNHDDISAFAAAGPLGSLVAKEMERFWAFAGQDYNVPHDPLALLIALRPDIFEFAEGRVTVEDDGLTVFAPAPGGPHRIVADMDVEAAAREIRTRILAGVTVPAGLPA